MVVDLVSYEGFCYVFLHLEQIAFYLNMHVRVGILMQNWIPPLTLPATELHTLSLTCSGSGMPGTGWHGPGMLLLLLTLLMMPQHRSAQYVIRTGHRLGTVGLHARRHRLKVRRRWVLRRRWTASRPTTTRRSVLAWRSWMQTSPWFNADFEAVDLRCAAVPHHQHHAAGVHDPARPDAANHTSTATLILTASPPVPISSPSASTFHYYFPVTFTILLFVIR